MTNADTMKVRAEIQQLDQLIDVRLESILARLEELVEQEQLSGLGEEIIKLRELSQIRSLKKALESKLQNSHTPPNEGGPLIEASRLGPQKE